MLEKEECINHVSKRLGTALRNLASSGKKAGVTLGGRGYNKLTQATITKLTANYDLNGLNQTHAKPDPLAAIFVYVNSDIFY